jgi:hypothetical protein
LWRYGGSERGKGSNEYTVLTSLKWMWAGMLERKLTIVKRTPIALGFCEACKKEFNSLQRNEDEAERELKALFDAHKCKPEDATKEAT